MRGQHSAPTYLQSFSRSLYVIGCLWLKLRIWCEPIRVVPMKTAGRVWGRPPGRAVSRTSPSTPPAAAVTEGPSDMKTVSTLLRNEAIG